MSIFFLDESFFAEDITEESWNLLSQSESEYEPSQQESERDEEQVGNIADVIYLNRSHLPYVQFAWIS